MIDAPPSPPNPQPALELLPSRQFAAWLGEHHVSLALTTYQAGKLMFLGCQPSGRLSVFERTFNRCMGLCSDGQTLWLSTLFQLWRFENSLSPGETFEGYDRLYVPRVGYTTGDCDIHDLACDRLGAPVFVNTLFSCLGVPSDRHNFVPIWKPPFISRLAAEDRCHLNGLAMRDGEPGYVTAVAASDTAEGWRDQRETGGVLIDCRANEIIATGLSMPHSPRYYRDQLWLLNAGTGYFGRVDLHTGRFEPITFCPGFLRGLTFVGDFAIVTTSLRRENKTLSALPLDDELARRRVSARCQLSVIDLRTGDLVHWVEIQGVVEEFYDVVSLPGVTRPMALGFKTSEVCRLISIGEPAPRFPVPAEKGPLR